MSRPNRDKALRAWQAAVAEEHRAKDRALASDDVDEAISAWLQAMHASRRASHALRAAPAAAKRSSDGDPGD